VRLVSENFVCIAVNKTEMVQSPGARLRYPAEQQLINLLTHGHSVNLGVFLSTADGQQLTNREIFRLHTTPEVLSTLREALARFGPVTPRYARPAWQDPDRGAGVRPDGSVRLALFVRYTDDRRPTVAQVFDSIILPAAQWQALQPPSRQAGARYAVPDEVARQFSRAIGAGSDPTQMLRPEDLTSAGLTGTVTEANGYGVTVELAGRFEGARRHVNGGEALPGQAFIQGSMDLAPDGRPLRLLMVSDGVFRMPWDRHPRPTGAVIDWQARAPASSPSAAPRS
jgi:hypothetical protein